MNYLVILSPDAQLDISSAEVWYLFQSFELVARFDADLRSSLERIEAYPRRVRIGRSNSSARPTAKFPYSVYFEIESNVVTVKAVLHQRRNDAHMWN